MIVRIAEVCDCDNAGMSWFGFDSARMVLRSTTGEKRAEEAHFATIGEINAEDSAGGKRILQEGDF